MLHKDHMCADLEERWYALAAFNLIVLVIHDDLNSSKNFLNIVYMINIAVMNILACDELHFLLNKKPLFTGDS